MQQGNPVDPLVRIDYRYAGENNPNFNPGRIISSGTEMEKYRFLKLFEKYFPEINLDRFSGFYIGQHGLMASPGILTIGGIEVEKLVESMYGEIGLGRLKEVFDQVPTEAEHMISKTGLTPSEGPASLTKDIVELALNPRQTVIGISTYIKNMYDDVKDTAFTVPVLLGENGAVPIELKDEKLAQKIRAVDSHLKEINDKADAIYEKIKASWNLIS